MPTGKAFAEQEHRPYDLVLCHAVLEWLAEPRTILTALHRLTATDGGSRWLYNKDGFDLTKSD